MDGNMQITKETLSDAINSCGLSNKEIEEGVLALIDIELSQNERPINQQLIDECYDLLHKLRYCASESVQISNPTMPIYLNMKRRRCGHKIQKYGLRVAAILILVFLSGILGEMLIPNDYLIANPSKDEQQLQIEGRSIEGTFIQEGLADPSNAISIINTRAFDDIVDVMGFVPEVPTWLPQGWNAQTYYATKSRFASKMSIEYSQGNNEHLIKYAVTAFPDVSQAENEFEQSKNGDMFVWNSRSVYVANNIDNLVVIWLEGTNCYSIVGSLTLEEAKMIVESLQRSN